MDTENDRLRLRINELETMIQTLISQDQMVEKYTILTNFVLLQAELERISKAYYQLEEDYDNQNQLNQQQNDINIQKLNKLIEHNQYLANLVEEIRADSYSPIKQTKQEIQENNALKSQINELQDKLNKSEIESQQQRLELEKQQDEIVEVMKELKECENLYKKSVEQYKSNIADLEEQIQELQSDNNIKNERLQYIDELDTKYSQIVLDFHSKNLEIQDLIQQNNFIQKENKLLHEDLDLYKTKINNEVQDLNFKQLQLKYDELSMSIDIIKRENQQSYTKELKKLEEQIQILKQDKDSQDIQISNLNKEIDELKQGNTHEIQRLNKEIEIQKANESYIKELKSDNKRMKQIIIDLTDSLQNYKITNKSYDHERIKTEIEQDYQNKYYKLQQEYNKLQQEYNKLQQEYNKLQQDHTGLQYDKKQVDEWNYQLHNQIKNLNLLSYSRKF